MSKTRILLADDHEVVRYGLISLIEQYSDLDVIAEASSGEQAFDNFIKHKPDICVLDISMPGLDGIETARKIKEFNPDTPILILTMHNEEKYLEEVLKSGVNGFILKNSDKNELIEAIRNVAAGKDVFSPSISRFLADRFVGSSSQTKETQQPDYPPLTPREREILDYISEAYTTKDIADDLQISPRTVETHRRNLMDKIGAKNTAELVRFALDKK